MKKVKRPVRPAKATLPPSWEAAPVDCGAPDALDIPDMLAMLPDPELVADEPEPEVAVPFSLSLPPVPACDVGETLSEAEAAAFLKASMVLAPEAGGLMTPTMPPWQCLPWEQ